MNERRPGQAHISETEHDQLKTREAGENPTPIRGAVEWLSDEEQSFWQLLVAAFRSAEGLIEDRIHTKADITFAGYTVLIALSETPEWSMTLTQLIGRLHWPDDRVARVLRTLESRMIVTVDTADPDEPTPETTTVEITGTGRDLFEQIGPDYVSSVRTAIFEQCTRDQRDQFRPILTAMIKAGDQQRLELQ